MLREGRSVPLAKIAAAAEVGVGTLYRRYPSREALIEALELRAYGLIVDLLKEIDGLALSGIDSVGMFLQRTVADGSQLVLPHHGAPWVGSDEAHQLRRSISDRISALLRRGVEDGTLRDDVSPQDIIIFGSFVALPLPAVDDWPMAVQRQIEMFLRAVGK